MKATGSRGLASMVSSARPATVPRRTCGCSRQRAHAGAARCPEHCPRLRLLAPQAARQEGLLRRLRHRRHGRLRPLLRRGPQAPGRDRVLPHLGQRLPRLDPALADGAGAADAPHHHRRQQRRPRDHQPAADRRRARRPLPRPPQQALLRKGDARLRAAARRAEPLPQRLRRLRLRRRLARSRAQPQRLQTRLSPRLRDPPRRRHQAADRPAPRQSRAAAADDQR